MSKYIKRIPKIYSDINEYLGKDSSDFTEGYIGSQELNSFNGKYTGSEWVDQVLNQQTGMYEGREDSPVAILNNIKEAIVSNRLISLKHQNTKFNDYKVLTDSDYSYELNWYPSDSYDNFLNLLKEPGNVGLLKKFGWIDDNNNPTDIKYLLNDYGFRSKNFTDKPGILFFGCSHTFGVGVDQHMSWPELICNHYNLECYNLGMPGKGLDLGAFFARLFIQDLCPNIEAICVLMPPPGRKSFFSSTIGDKEEYDYEVIPWAYNNDTILSVVDVHGLDRRNDEFWHNKLPMPEHPDIANGHVDSEILLRNLIWKRESQFMNELSYISMIKTIAYDYNVPCFIQNNALELHGDHLDLARDLLHPGNRCQKNIAEQFLLHMDLDK